MATTRDADEARTARIVELRRARTSFRDIGTDVNLSASRCHEIYYRALAEIPATEVVAARAEECELVDDAVAGLLAIANDDDVPARSRVEAWTSLRGWSEHRARLLGLNAPSTSRVQVVTEDDIDAEIARLTRDLAQNDPTR